MVQVIGAPTLSDALCVLKEQVLKNEEHGIGNLIFCEDRLTLLCERSVLEVLGGSFTTEVTTFARYLSGGAKVLSKQGSVMKISELIDTYAAELSCFKRGAAQAVYETIAQLSASCVTAEMLKTSAQSTDGILKKKLLDLALILEKYEAFLNASGLVDENGYLGLLPEKIAADAQAGKLNRTEVFFFGFPSFTRQAQEGIRATLENAFVTGIFVAGRGEMYTNEAASTFRKIAEEYGDVTTRQIRSSLTGDALMLSERLFSSECYKKDRVRSTQVFSFTTEDEGREAEIIAALIKKYIIEEHGRYRDCVVLVPSADSFSAVGHVFDEYKIPYFADEKRPFSEHPFCAFTLALLAAAADGGLPASIDDVASNIYFGKADEYRNYLAKFGGYRGAFKREIKDDAQIKGYNRETLIPCRERTVRLLSLFPKKAKATAYTDAVRALYREVDGETVTENLQSRTEGALSDFLEITPLTGILSEIDAVAGERTFTAKEFSDLLLSGAEALEISMIPKYFDAVFLGDATESKFERAALVFATGLTDALPRAATDTAVISDREIDRLGELKVEIEPAIAKVNARARESLGLNLCAFSERLYLSYPMKNRGEETARSEILSDCEKIFDLPPMPEVFPYDCSEYTPAVLKLLKSRQAFTTGEINDASLFSTLAGVLREREDTADMGRLDTLLSGGKKQPIARGEELYFWGGRISPTLLEQYFACPYAGFCKRGLRLVEREERTVLDTDAGTFVHAVLEAVAKKFNEMKGEEECRALARTAGETLLKSSRFSALTDTKQGEYTGERLIQEGVEVSAAAYRQLAASAFRMRAAEETVELPALALYGKTDRVDETDEYVRVIDYKTGHIDDKPVAYYTGRRLQLELYLKGASAGKKPAGAFYFPAADNFSKPDEAKYNMLGFFNGED
ncbi:MAG: PD-(D/E)XK nuclease family protein [Clostridiales bacterium]|nr:PD-(D/E)XK nuclease family protein [Clostridiales bacterium]